MKLLSIAQYAKKSGVSKQAILKRIKNGTLPNGIIAEKVDTFWVIIESETK
jgi:predicted DNA-binding transcriptional regulator AlpA